MKSKVFLIYDVNKKSKSRDLVYLIKEDKKRKTNKKSLAKISEKNSFRNSDNEVQHVFIKTINIFFQTIWEFR